MKVKTKELIGPSSIDVGMESEWSDPLEVSMPKIKSVNTPIIQFLENHPILLILFQKFLHF